MSTSMSSCIDVQHISVGIGTCTCICTGKSRCFCRSRLWYWSEGYYCSATENGTVEVEDKCKYTYRDQHTHVRIYERKHQ